MESARNAPWIAVSDREYGDHEPGRPGNQRRGPVALGCQQAPRGARREWAGFAQHAL